MTEQRPIRAIETEYAGCRFRSRLEARWAVFFDALGIPWEYEAQGYESEAGRYLPDFWLPEMDLWAEVKGQFSHADLVKTTGALWSLREPRDRQIMPQLLMLGPIPRPGWAWTHPRFDLLGDLLIWRHAYFAQPVGLDWYAASFGEIVTLPRDVFARSAEELTDIFRDVTASHAPRLTIDPAVDDAYRAARSARFEFGERG